MSFSWWDDSEGGERSRVRLEGWETLDVGITKSSDVSIRKEGDMVAVVVVVVVVGVDYRLVVRMNAMVE